MHNTTKPTLTTPGDTITWTSPNGATTITVQYIRPNTYTVTTYQRTHRITDQCGSYTSENAARAVARGYAILARAEDDTAPVTLADLAERGEHRQVRPTMAGAQLADVTDAQHRALATAEALGRVRRGRGGESVTTLKALARKGLLTLSMRPGRRYDVDYGVITEAGRRELARLDAEAAERDRVARLVA